jgi:hypothetical protein
MPVSIVLSLATTYQPEMPILYFFAAHASRANNSSYVVAIAC